jgi:hypothetical protein
VGRTRVFYTKRKGRQNLFKKDVATVLALGKGFGFKPIQVTGTWWTGAQDHDLPLMRNLLRLAFRLGVV